MQNLNLPLRRREARPMLSFVAVLLAMTLAAPAVLADSTMKRSAGEMKRSGGSNRKGNDLGSRASGRSSMRSNSRSGPTLPSERKKWEEEAEEDEPAKKKKRKPRPTSDDEEEEEPDFGSRSLGRVCMYGANGEVIFRPKGAACKGDAPAARAESSDLEGARTRARDAKSRKNVAPGNRFGAPAKRRKSRPRPTSECVYGSRGQVVHTPAGEFCPPKRPPS